MLTFKFPKAMLFGSMALATILTTSCSGGGSGPLRVLATGEPVTGSDYPGKTFPLLFILGQDDEAGAVIKGGEGRITITEDGNTVQIEIPGEDKLTFTYSGPSEEGDLYAGIGLNGEPITVTVSVEDNGEYVFARCGCGEFEGFDYASAFGFETPSALRPTDSATYMGASSGVVVAFEGDPEYLLIPGGGSGELTANFVNGSISGTLINASTSVALPDTFSAFESVEAVGANLTMDGLITSTGFDGTVDGFLFIEINGLPFSIDTTFSNTDVDGKFFGNDGETAAATYKGDLDIADFGPDLNGPNASFAGIFVGTDPSLGPVE